MSTESCKKRCSYILSYGFIWIRRTFDFEKVYEIGRPGRIWLSGSRSKFNVHYCLLFIVVELGLGLELGSDLVSG